MLYEFLRKKFLDTSVEAESPVKMLYAPRVLEREELLVAAYDPATRVIYYDDHYEHAPSEAQRFIVLHETGHAELGHSGIRSLANELEADWWAVTHWAKHGDTFKGQEAGVRTLFWLGKRMWGVGLWRGLRDIPPRLSKLGGRTEAEEIIDLIGLVPML